MMVWMCLHHHLVTLDHLLIVSASILGLTCYVLFMLSVSHFLHIVVFTQNVYDTEWPFMCSCAVQKLITHVLSLSSLSYLVAVFVWSFNMELILFSTLIIMASTYDVLCIILSFQ